MLWLNASTSIITSLCVSERKVQTSRAVESKSITQGATKILSKDSPNAAEIRNGYLPNTISNKGSRQVKTKEHRL